MKRIGSLLIVVLFLVVMACAAQVNATDRDIVRVTGEVSRVGLVGTWAERFMQDVPGRKVVVIGGGGTTKGIRRLISGEAEIVVAGRKMHSEERREAAKRGMKVVEAPLGHDHFLIIVKVANAVKDLTVDQVKGLFTGAITNWKELGSGDWTVVPHVPKIHDDAAIGWWKDVFLGGVPLAANTHTAGDWRETCYRVGSKDTEPGVVSFIPHCLFTMFKKTAKHGDIIRAVPIKEGPDSPSAVAAPEEVMHRKVDYPIERPIYLYYDGSKAGTTTEIFVRYCLAQLGG